MRTFIMLGALAALVGCGGDSAKIGDSGVTTTGAGAATGTGTGSGAATGTGTGTGAGTGTGTGSSTPMPGTITVEANGLTGISGKVYLAFASVNPTAAPDGAACLPVSGDPADVSGEIREVLADPCTVGAPVVFDPGVVTVSAGVYTPGQQTPAQCAETTVDVDGDVVVTMPALGPC